MKPTRLALIGMGKIARDQHLPAIADNPNFVLAATASRNEPGFGNVPHAKTLEALLATGTPFDAVVLCTPPQVRYPLAHLALSRGFHVFLEKPPGASLGEVEALSEAAAKRRLTLFASWHSRHAPGVEPARAWLTDREIMRVSVTWREDVRVWHPGQAWIWEPGGLGVFDPGINALSILTHILPQPFFLTEATLSLPENRAAPIAAQMQFRDALGTPITMDLDWRETGPQRWDIEVETDAGNLKLSSGGAVLSLPTGTHGEKEREYPSLYEQFEKLLRTGTSDVDVRPLRHVADAFLRGHRNAVEAFYC
jgi:D-galactose 1-dehydrogenase